MRGHDEGRPALLLLGQVVPHVRRGHRVEAGGGLIAEDPVGLVQGGPDQRDLLRHAAGVGGEDRVASVREPETFEQRVDAARALRLGNSVQITEAIEILGRGVAAVEASLVRHDSQARTHLVEVLREAKTVELDDA